MVVPQKFEGLLTAFDSTPGFSIGDELASLLWAMFFVPLDPTSTHKKYVAWTEFDVAITSHFFKIRHGNGML
jgi:hypothetical protein